MTNIALSTCFISRFTRSLRIGKGSVENPRAVVVGHVRHVGKIWLCWDEVCDVREGAGDRSRSRMFQCVKGWQDRSAVEGEGSGARAERTGARLRGKGPEDGDL